MLIEKLGICMKYYSRKFDLRALLFRFHSDVTRPIVDGLWSYTAHGQKLRF